MIRFAHPVRNTHFAAWPLLSVAVNMSGPKLITPEMLASLGISLKPAGSASQKPALITPDMMARLVGGSSDSLPSQGSSDRKVVRIFDLPSVSHGILQQLQNSVDLDGEDLDWDDDEEQELEPMPSTPAATPAPSPTPAMV